MFIYNLVNNKIDIKKFSCNFHLASFYLVNSFFWQSERESTQLASLLFVWKTCFGRSCRLQKLFCTDTDFTEQAFSHVERHAYEVFIVEIYRIHPSFSTAVWNIWSQKWKYLMGKRKTLFQRVFFQINRLLVFWLSCSRSISEASI